MWLCLIEREAHHLDENMVWVFRVATEYGLPIIDVKNPEMRI